MASSIAFGSGKLGNFSFAPYNISLLYNSTNLSMRKIGLSIGSQFQFSPSKLVDAYTKNFERNSQSNQKYDFQSLFNANQTANVTYYSLEQVAQIVDSIQKYLESLPQTTTTQTTTPATENTVLAEQTQNLTQAIDQINLIVNNTTDGDQNLLNGEYQTEWVVNTNETKNSQISLNLDLTQDNLNSISGSTSFSLSVESGTETQTVQNQDTLNTGNSSSAAVTQGNKNTTGQVSNNSNANSTNPANNLNSQSIFNTNSGTQQLTISQLANPFPMNIGNEQLLPDTPSPFGVVQPAASNLIFQADSASPNSPLQIAFPIQAKTDETPKLFTDTLIGNINNKANLLNSVDSNNNKSNDKNPVNSNNTWNTSANPAQITDDLASGGTSKNAFTPNLNDNSSEKASLTVQSNNADNNGNDDNSAQSSAATGKGFAGIEGLNLADFAKITKDDHGMLHADKIQATIEKVKKALENIRSVQSYVGDFQTQVSSVRDTIVANKVNFHKKNVFDVFSEHTKIRAEFESRLKASQQIQINSNVQNDDSKDTKSIKDKTEEQFSFKNNKEAGSEKKPAVDSSNKEVTDMQTDSVKNGSSFGGSVTFGSNSISKTLQDVKLSSNSEQLFVTQANVSNSSFLKLAVL
ncbi:MAG: hypothetical protein HW421_2963 [Ignavibacteria bacterium]|nr:hypothetical protein [Ignavibacteria bacterium]